MSNRFCPSWHDINIALSNVLDHIPGTEPTFISVYNQVNTTRTTLTSREAVLRKMRGVVQTSRGEPWHIFDTMSEYICNIHEHDRLQVAQELNIPTGRPYEFLRIGIGGEWQLSWVVNPSEADVDERDIRLTWYVPPDKKTAPLVPESLIDYIAAVVLLLRSNLVLPAAAVLCIAVEAVLWEALGAKGISRETERVSYQEAEWSIKRKGDKYLMAIHNADSDGKDLAAVMNEPDPELKVRAIRMTEQDDSEAIKVLVDKACVGFLASRKEINREQVSEQGLTPAIQRGYKENITPLDNLNDELDKTLIQLRNNLIHLHASDPLNPPIKIPDGEIKTLEELKAYPTLIGYFLRWLIDSINIVYKT